MSLLVSDVSKKFGQKQAVDSISFEMKNPGIFGLLGTNGAGKTTTIRMILGIIFKDTGTITWNGEKTSRESVKFGYLPEERGVYPKAKVLDQILYFASLRNIKKEMAKKNAFNWFEKLKVTEYINLRAEQLSKGNQQKIQLIASIVHNPELIILDEPFNGLDPLNVELFRDVLNELVEKGVYIVMSSHQMNAVEEYCKELLILKNGKTILKGNLSDIKASYGRNNLVINTKADILDIANENSISLKHKNSVSYEFTIKSDEQAYGFLKKLINLGLPIDKFEIKEPSLHEIFIDKVGEDNE